MHTTEPLTLTQQLVLEMLAVAGYAVSEETLQKLVPVVSKDAFEVRSHLKNLQHLRLVGNGPGYGSWVLAADMAEVALRHAVKDGLVDPLLAALQRLEPHRQPPPQTMLRLAAYRRDWAEVARIEQKYLYQAAPILAQSLANPFEAEWFEGMPDRLRQRTLTIMLANGITAFQPVEDVLTYALTPPVADPVLFCATQVLFRQGRLDAYERLVTSTTLWWTPAHLGALAFVHGDDAAAESLFAQSLEVWRKGTGHRKAIFSDENMVCYFLCLLRQRKYKEIKTLARGINKEDPYRIALGLIRDVAERELGARDTDPPREWEARGHARATQFVYMLHQAWTHQPLNEAWLADFQQAAEQADFTFWVEEAKGLREGSGRLVGCLRRSEPWEQVMAGLEELASTLEPLDREARLVWILGADLTAREQHADKNGWNKGKPIGFKTLLEKHASMAFLSPQDRQICSTIVREGASYRLDMQRALPALVGHPLVFNDQGTLLDIVSSPPELSILQEPGGLRIRMTPPYAGQSVELLQDTPTRYRVVVFSTEHQKLGQLVRHGVRVPTHAAERLAQLGTAVSGLMTVHSDLGVGVGATEVPWDNSLRAVLVPWGVGLKLQFVVQPLGTDGPTFKPGQGGDVVVAEVGGRRVQTRRDRDDERRRLQAFVESSSVLCPGPVEWMLEELDACLTLLEELAKTSDMVIQWPQGEKFKLAGQASTSSLSMTIARSNDWFALEGGVRVDEQRVVQMAELLKQAKAGRFVKLSDTEFLALTDEFRRRLLELAHYAEVQRHGVRVHPLAAAALQAITREAGSIAADEAWKAHLAKLDKPHLPQVPGTLQAELRPYQVEGYRWLSRLAAWGVGACLADDMGLGKTVQALAVMVERAPQGPTLVIAPASVAMNWVAEARRFAPTLKVRLYSEEDRKAPFDTSPFDLIVCTYGLLFQDRDRLAGISWTTLVLDEAQAIKNQGTRRSQAAKSLSAGFRLVTTGTPVENHLAELWNLFDFLNPGLLGSLDSFHRRFATPITRVQDPDARHALRTLISPFILRRTKSHVLSELPPRTDIVVHVELNETERGLYEALREDALERLHMRKKERQEKDLKFQILAELTKLRRACCHPRLVLPSAPLVSSKLAAFGEILDELLDNRHKALVFSQFVDHLSLVREYLDGRNIRYQYLDGSTPLPARQQAVDAFQAGVGDLFLISLRAGGTGLNLTAADYVIHLDPWWNPAVEDQASDRAHRIGQQRPVTVYRMVTRGTIEEGIVSLHSQKRELADALLEGTEVSAALSADELLHLLSDASF